MQQRTSLCPRTLSSCSGYRPVGSAGQHPGVVDVLLAHRRLPADSIITALEAANRVGIIDPAVVTVEARRHTDTPPVADVVPIGALSRYDRPAPAVAVYDQLLNIRDAR